MNLKRLNDAFEELHEGDLLLFRRRGLISIAGRGIHSHAAKLSWWDGVPFVVEVREWHGGRAVTLASQVKRYPERIDVYAVNPGNRWPEYDRDAAAVMMRLMAGCDYGYGGIVAAACLHLPVVRIFAKPAVEDHRLSVRPPFCSQAVAAADRIGGGVDPVPGLSDRITEPADLARSQLYRYRFTLVE